MSVNNWLALIGIAIIVICLYLLVAHLSRVKCPKCGQRNCIEMSRKETSRQKVMFEEQEVLTHVENRQGLAGGFAKSHAELTAQFGKPDSTTIRKYKVPGERIHYLATYKCNDCEHTFSQNIYVDDKPPTVR